MTRSLDPATQSILALFLRTDLLDARRQRQLECGIRQRRIHFDLGIIDQGIIPGRLVDLLLNWIATVLWNPELDFRNQFFHFRRLWRQLQTFGPDRTERFRSA